MEILQISRQRSGIDLTKNIDWMQCKLETYYLTQLQKWKYDTFDGKEVALVCTPEVDGA